MSSGQHSSKIRNMLTKSNPANQPQGCSPKNEISHHHQQQQQQQQQQQEALASLFRSLSSLAHGGAQMTSNQQLNTDTCPQTSLMNLSMRNLQTHDTASSSSSSQSSVHPSLHGVVAAAAIMQQQLVTAAIGHEQSMPIQSTTTNTNQCYNQSGQLQSDNQVPFLGDSMPASYTHVSHSANFSNLEHEVQYSPIDDATRSQQQENQHHQQPHRINYCTICNKELCNKYFMKTHMLKMHGINLEVDQQPGSEEEEAGQSHVSDNIDQESDEDHHHHHNNNNNNNNSSVESNNATVRQPRHSVAGKSKQLSDCQQANKYKSSSSGKPTTSVMNGFAGNSMGGVVCDICNKELCSKYFLKVHKQNTHGIMTDYQDTNQFVYPFSNTLAHHPFMPTQIPPINMPTNNDILTFPSNACLKQNSNLPIDAMQTELRFKPSNAKRARTNANNKQSIDRAQPIGADQHIDSIYRLMMSQQQTTGAGATSCGQPQFVTTPFDSISANPMNALICFGALNPFGPTGLSPAMVVDMILRNQHLINRTKGVNQQAVTGGQCSASKSSKDKNNNDSKQGKSAPTKSTKESAANNSRYFTHYTEACPMCDRRFKSIKWLKTHMMNDHKQEIGTYMQMIVQNMYANKGQPPTQLSGQPYDQSSGYSTTGNFAHCNVASPQIQQQQQQQQHQQQLQLQLQQQLQQQQTISNNGFQSPHTSILQTEQYSIVQNYLNQQRQMLHQQHQQQQKPQTQEMIDNEPEPVFKDQLTKLENLTNAHLGSEDNSSSSSVDKTSPRSLITNLDNEDDNQQLDLTMKFSLDTRPQSRKRSLELNEDDYLNDQDANSDCTRSSYNQNDEQQQRSTSDAIETINVSPIQVKTIQDA